MSTPLRLLVGLGNPGPRYSDTRHNAGVWWLDALCAKHRIKLRAQKSFQAEMAEANLHGQDCLLVFPTTFMNNSGQAVRAIAKYHQITPAEILVAHDELDLPAATLKLKWGGGHGGHNGLRDIISQLQDPAFLRLRIGIGRPPTTAPTIDYVLHAPSLAERTQIDNSIEHALDVTALLITGEREKAMHQLHSQKRE